MAIIHINKESLVKKCKKLYAKEFPMHVAYQKEVEQKLKTV